MTDVLASLHVRRAQFSDGGFVYRLSQEPSVRAMSTRGQSFTPEEHERWWERRFHEPQTVCYIAEWQGMAVAYMRYTAIVDGAELYSGGPIAHESNIAEVSIAVDPIARGKGIATKLLIDTRLWAADALAVERHRALILLDNVASRRAFTAAGYEPVGRTVRMGKWHAIYDLYVGPKVEGMPPPQGRFNANWYRRRRGNKHGRAPRDTH